MNNNPTVTDIADRALNMVRDAKTLIFDTEGSGLDWKKNYPVGYIFCVGPRNSECVYVPIRAGGGGNLPDPHVITPKTETDKLVVHQFEKELAKAFKARQHLTVGHYLKIDIHMSANASIMLGRNLSCTLNTEVLLNEYARAYSLEACAERYGVVAKKGTEMYEHLALLFGCPADKKSMSHFWKLAGNDPLAVEYALGDGFTTYALHQAQITKIREQNLGQIYDLENALIWTLFRMERRGIKVDVKYLQRLLEDLDKRVKDAFKKLPPKFNVRSSKDVQAYIESVGHTDWPTTTLGNPSFVEKWLKSFPEGKSIVTVRKLTNLANTFIKPLINEHVHNGRVHATLNQLKSDDYGTPARLSCSAPNLQQIPKRDKELAILFRRAFIADKDKEFNEADWSQCEPRLYSHYSQEPSLLKGYNQTPPIDAHDIVAKMLNVERDPTAKRMNMGLFTGMYPETFAVHMEWSLEKATEKWNQWHAAFPHIKPFQEQAKQVLLRRGYVKTILGRRLRLEHPRFAYRAVSKIIQGGNADIMKWMLNKIDIYLEREKDETELLTSVHDSLAWQSPKKDKKVNTRLLVMMTDVLNPPFNLRVPFAADHNKGANWAEATFGK